jgi:hypothetical protein
MQYFGRALALSWPQLLVGILWLAVALMALRYARATRRPIFLYSGITALLLMFSEVLSPIRIAYHYFTHNLLCATTTQCKVELLSGAYKYEQLIDGIAVLVFLLGLYLEVSRARRRAAASSAARAANTAAPGVPPVGANSAGAYAGPYQAAPLGANSPTGAFAGPYQAAPQGQPIGSYDAMIPDDFDPAAPPRFSPPAEEDQPTLYRRPASGSGSF